MEAMRCCGNLLARQSKHVEPVPTIATVLQLQLKITRASTLRFTQHAVKQSSNFASSQCMMLLFFSIKKLEVFFE